MVLNHRRADDPDAAVAAAESSEPSEMERRRLSWRGKACGGRVLRRCVQRARMCGRKEVVCSCVAWEMPWRWKNHVQNDTTSVLSSSNTQDPDTPCMAYIHTLTPETTPMSVNAIHGVSGIGYSTRRELWRFNSVSTSWSWSTL